MTDSTYIQDGALYVWFSNDWQRSIAKMRLLALCLSVCPHVRTREPLKKFSTNQTFQWFVNICSYTLISAKIA
jgi:hypothetical protein